MPPRALPPGNYGSTYLNSQIQTYGDLAYYVKTLLGAPSVPVELTDGQFKIIIDEAVENFTRWGVRGEEKMLIFCPGNNYNPNCGIKLDELVNPCNTCIATCSSTVVTGTACNKILLGTASSLLSVGEPTYTPNTYYDVTQLQSPLLTSHDFSQLVTLNYNPKLPWNTHDFCDFDTIRIRPKNSDWYELSTNSNVWPSLSSLATSALSSYAISSLPTSAFYSPLTATTWPLEAYMNVQGGMGSVFPMGDLSRFEACSAKSDIYWRIDPNLPISFLDCNKAPYIFLDKCKTITTGYLTASYLSGTDQSLLDNPWIVEKDINGDGLDDIKLSYVCYISAKDGSVFPPSHLNIKSNTYVELLNFPYCVKNNQIPLNWNNGVISNFSLCNSALDTFGDIPVPTVRFLKGCLPPDNIFYKSLSAWENGGFRFKKELKAGDICVTKTPCYPEVDIDFFKTTCAELTGTQVSEIATYYDDSLGGFRKIQNCFNVDYANNGYGSGSGGDNYLFSLDLAVAQNLFGNTLVGNGDTQNRFDLTSYHLAMSYVENVRKMFRFVSWEFNPKTQFLKIYPEPKYGSNTCYLLGVNLEPAIEEVLNEEYVRKFTMGRALQILGKVRGRYGQISLVGGAVIGGDQATAEGDRLIAEADTALKKEQMYEVGTGIRMF